MEKSNLHVIYLTSFSRFNDDLSFTVVVYNIDSKNNRKEYFVRRIRLEMLFKFSRESNAGI